MLFLVFIADPSSFIYDAQRGDRLHIRLTAPDNHNKVSDIRYLIPYHGILVLERGKRMKLLTVVEAIIEKLKQDVHNGVYSTGASLNIDELARTYGVSKTPIREALGHLAKEGLVTYRARIGWSVCSLSKEDFDHYLEVRYVLRKFISDNLCPYLDRLDFKKLEDMNHSMKIYLSEGKYRELIETDDFFHMTIFSLYPNPIIIAYLSQVSSLIKLQRIGMLENRLQHNEYSLFHNAPHEHDAIIEALKTRNQVHISEVSERHQKTIMSALTPIKLPIEQK